MLSLYLQPRAREDREGNANIGLLAALLVEACGREHLDCIELLLQKMMKPSPKRNVSNTADLSDSGVLFLAEDFSCTRQNSQSHVLRWGSRAVITWQIHHSWILDKVVPSDILKPFYVHPNECTTVGIGNVGWKRSSAHRVYNPSWFLVLRTIGRLGCSQERFPLCARCAGGRTPPETLPGRVEPGCCQRILMSFTIFFCCCPLLLKTQPNEREAQETGVLSDAYGSRGGGSRKHRALTFGRSVAQD